MECLQRIGSMDTSFRLVFSPLTIHSPQKIEMQKDSDGQRIVTPLQLNGLWIH
jgi:hypothetical protein